MPIFKLSYFPSSSSAFGSESATFQYHSMHFQRRSRTRVTAARATRLGKYANHVVTCGHPANRLWTWRCLNLQRRAAVRRVRQVKITLEARVLPLLQRPPVNLSGLPFYIVGGLLCCTKLHMQLSTIRAAEMGDSNVPSNVTGNLVNAMRESSRTTA